MWKQIFKITALAGSLDIIAAFIQAYITNRVPADIVLKYIASGIFGNEAFSGGYEFAILGLLIHFLIVFSITLVYFFAYPKLKLLRQHILLSAFIITVIAWAVTTRIIIPFSKIQTSPFHFKKAIISLSILYFCIGLPIAFFARRLYNKQ
jgi:hypothetical protein